MSLHPSYFQLFIPLSFHSVPWAVDRNCEVTGLDLGLHLWLVLCIWGRVCVHTVHHKDRFSWLRLVAAFVYICKHKHLEGSLLLSQCRWPSEIHSLHEPTTSPDASCYQAYSTRFSLEQVSNAFREPYGNFWVDANSVNFTLLGVKFCVSKSTWTLSLDSVKYLLAVWSPRGILLLK